MIESILRVLVLGVLICYFLGVIASRQYRSRFWWLAAKLFLTIFVISGLYVAVNMHPVVALIALVILPFIAYNILKLFYSQRAEERQRPAPSFFSLRTSGKTPVEISPEHPFGTGEGEEER